MPRGTVDLNTSRRINFLDCTYWLVEERDTTPIDKIVYEKIPTGTFEAQFTSSVEEGSSVIGGAFMFNSKTASISTENYIPDLKRNCIVEFWGEYWRIDSVSKTPIRSNFQMSNEIRFKYFLELKR